MEEEKEGRQVVIKIQKKEKNLLKKSSLKRQSKHQNHIQLWRGFENGYTENLNQVGLVS